MEAEQQRERKRMRGKHTLFTLTLPVQPGLGQVSLQDSHIGSRDLEPSPADFDVNKSKKLNSAAGGNMKLRHLSC